MKCYWCCVIEVQHFGAGREVILGSSLFRQTLGMFSFWLCQTKTTLTEVHNGLQHKSLTGGEDRLVGCGIFLLGSSRIVVGLLICTIQHLFPFSSSTPGPRMLIRRVNTVTGLEAVEQRITRSWACRFTSVVLQHQSPKGRFVYSPSPE